MDETDLSGLGLDEPTPQERALALAAALRGQRPDAQPGAVSPQDAQEYQFNASLGNLLGGGFRDTARELVGGSERQQQQQIQNQRYAALDDFHNNEAAARLLGLSRLQLKKAGNGETVAFNPLSGQTDTVRDAPPPRPIAARGGKGGAGGDSTKALASLLKDFDPSGARTGQFGKDYAVTQAADKLRRLTATDPNLWPQQMTELSTSLASLVGGGGGAAQSQIEHLTPHTLSGDYAKIAQWVTSDPHGAGQQAFVKAMMETAEREDAGAKDRIRNVQLSRAPAHIADWRKFRGDMAPLAGKFLKGLTPDELDAVFGGTYQPKADGAGPRTIIKKQVNRALGKTRVTYSDGTTETLDGLQ